MGEFTLSDELSQTESNNNILNEGELDERKAETQEIVLSLEDLSDNQKRAFLVLIGVFVIETFLLFFLQIPGDLFRIFMSNRNQQVISYITDFLQSFVIYIFFLFLGVMLYQGFALLTLERKRLTDLQDIFYWSTAFTAFLAFVTIFTSLFLQDLIAVQLALLLFYISFYLWISLTPVGYFMFIDKSNLVDSTEEQSGDYSMNSSE